MRDENFEGGLGVDWPHCESATKEPVFRDCLSQLASPGDWFWKRAKPCETRHAALYVAGRGAGLARSGECQAPSDFFREEI